MKCVKVTVCENYFSSVALQKCVLMTYRKWGLTCYTLCVAILKHNFILSPKSNLISCFLYYGDSCGTGTWMAQCFLHSKGHLEVWALKDEGKHWVFLIFHYTLTIVNIPLCPGNLKPSVNT